MNTEQGELYVLLAEEDGEWERPIPARIAIRDAVTAATDLEEADLHDLDEYLDRERLRELLDGDGEDSQTFRIEGHDVTITADGDITVE
ncbi:MAG: HalOD1 output domain-containing protein [Natrialbaceae archaeon]